MKICEKEKKNTRLMNEGLKAKSINDPYLDSGFRKFV